MNKFSETHTEGSPAIEQAEQQALGTTTYQKAEVVHKFAEENPWLHPLLLGVGVVLIVLVGVFITRSFHKKS